MKREAALGWAFCLLLIACGAPNEEREVAPEPAPPAPPTLTHGTLRVSVHGRDGETPGPVHRQQFRKEGSYQAMADVDLRGFLDGRFQYGWNQPDQVHVRVGRRKSSPRYGETELFRVVQRWDDLGVPRDASVEEASLEISIERGIDRRVTVLLYELVQDFSPGRGGAERNNTGPPEAGDVWWGERAHRQTGWGLPGAGFASETHPRADTRRAALAQATYRPGATTLRFASDSLRAMIEDRVRAERPLGFLLRLSDVDEDAPASLIYLYSAEEGNTGNPARRPRLTLAWRAPAQRIEVDREVLLEPGRFMQLPPLSIRNGDHLAVSFDPAPASDPLTLEWRVQGDSSWHAVAGPIVSAEDQTIELRALAALHPVALGKPFETTLRDTWIRTAPPEDQELRFTLVSPSGKKFEDIAVYEGDYRFSFSFLPEELGRWRYRFAHEFEFPYESAEGIFDVVATERTGILAALEALSALLDREGVVLDEQRIPVHAPRFWHLERALLALETPESFVSPEGRTRFAKLTQLREVLGDRPVPAQPPRRPMKRDF